MLRPIRLSTAAVLLAVTLAGGRAWAENEGREDLDRATEAKLVAKSPDELGEVIRLCESALEKGLDEGNARFAKVLLASTLSQRGSMRAMLFFRSGSGDPKSAEVRKAALDDLEKAVKLDPEQARALFYIARLHLVPGGDRQRATEALQGAIDRLAGEPLLRARALVLRSGIEKDPEKKMADLDEAIRISPRDAAALHVRALVRAALGKLEPALADLDKAIELAPRVLVNYEAKAAVLVRLKKYDEALVSLDKARQLSPDSARPLLKKARIHAAQRNLDAALTDLDQAHSIDPNNVEVLLSRAVVYRALDEKQKALDDVDKVLRLKPELSGARRIRAMLLADMDRREEAITELEKLRKLNPKDVTILLQLGMWYIAEKKQSRAIELFSAALAERPGNWIALRGRGDAQLNLGKHQPAVADYEKALKLRPKDAGILNNLAWVLATSPVDGLRDGPRALELATKACELTAHKQAHVLSTLAAAYAETGDFESAVKWSEKAVEIGGEDQLEVLKKELESYRAKRPWRELLSAGQNP